MDKKVLQRWLDDYSGLSGTESPEYNEKYNFVYAVIKTATYLMGSSTFIRCLLSESLNEAIVKAEEAKKKETQSYSRAVYKYKRKIEECQAILDSDYQIIKEKHDINLRGIQSKKEELDEAIKWYNDLKDKLAEIQVYNPQNEFMQVMKSLIIKDINKWLDIDEMSINRMEKEVCAVTHDPRTDDIVFYKRLLDKSEEHLAGLDAKYETIIEILKGLNDFLIEQKVNRRDYLQ